MGERFISRINRSSSDSWIHESEDDRLIRDMNRSPMEKLMLFTQMIRRERMYKQGRISESDDIQNL